MPKLLGRKRGTVGGDLSLEKRGQWWNRAKNFSETFYVLGDTLNDFEDAILACPGLPAVGDIIDGCALRKKTPKETDTVIFGGVKRGLWEIELFYDSRIDPDQMDNNASPTSRRPKRRWYSMKEDERLFKDAETGLAVIGQSGEEIVLMDTVVFPILEIERWEDYPFDPVKIRKYTNKCNLETFYGAPPGCALMNEITSDEEVIERALYEKVKYQIKFGAKEENEEDELSKSEILHQSYQYRDAATGSSAPIAATDKNGTHIRVNIRYDPNGAVGEGGTGGELLGPNDPAQFIPFFRKKKISFTPLSLYF